MYLKNLLGDVQPNGRDLHGSPSPDYGEAYRFPQIPGWVHSIRTEALEQLFACLKGADAASENLVFASKNGRAPLRPENVLKRVIHPSCERLGLPKVGWHDLRHTSATLLHQHEPLRVAQEILGHSDLQTTLGYTHVLPGRQREAMKRLEQVVLFPNVPTFATVAEVRN